MDVFPEMTFNDIKAIVEGEIEIPPNSQHFFYNQNPVTDTTKTLEQVGVGEGDMLGMAVQDPGRAMPSRRGGSQQASVRSSSGQRQQEGPDAERMRLHIVGDPRMLAEVRRQDPQLALAANDKAKFHKEWNERQRQAAQAESEKNAQIALLNADPFNMEAQKKIAEMIRQEAIQANVQKALEENPECESFSPLQQSSVS